MPLVFFLDALKGFVPAALGLFYFGSVTTAILAGMCAVLGHSLPIFAGFKGGKGVATGLGILLAISPDVSLLTAILGGTIVGLTRYVSLATIVSCVFIPTSLYFFGYPRFYILIVTFICLFVLYRHRGNISRLLKGQENKV